MQRIWMTLHSSGKFAISEGRRTELSRLLCSYQTLLKKEFPSLIFGALPSTTPPTNRFETIDCVGEVAHLKLPDPYSRGGGFELKHMCLMRWFIVDSSHSASKNFGYRRFYRFVKNAKNLPIYPNDWNWEAQTDVRRRAWFLAKNQDRILFLKKVYDVYGGVGVSL